jgi:hypothetical protein
MRVLEDRLVRLLNRRPARQRRPPEDHLHLGTARSLLGDAAQPCAWSAATPRHTFICGRTGSGKTTLLLRVMEEHLRLGVPFLFLDFHGPATEQILAMPAARLSTRPVLLFEPWSDPVLGWNPLEVRPGDAPHAVVRELLAMFHRRLWPDAWGPRMEELLRNTLLALVEAELTLLEATTFLASPEFRRTVLPRVSLPDVREFWTVRFERLAPSQKTTVTETVLNKLSVFHDPVLKYVVGQRVGTLNFDQVLEQGDTLLVNLAVGPARGHSFLLATLLVAAFKAAVYRRRPDARPYGVILDEFQEMVAVDSLDDYLRSFRKFGCAVYLATQHLQMSPDLRAALFANCHRFCSFAASAADAAVLGREFGPPDGDLAADVLPNLRTGQAVLKTRGDRAVVVQVQAPQSVGRSDQLAEGRAANLARGRLRQDLDREFLGRLGSAKTVKRPRTSEASTVPAMPTTTDDELPEGYDSD